LGLQPIQDLTVAQKLLDKVNDMNISTGRDCLIVASIFAALPKDVTAPIAALGVIAAGAYFVLNSKEE